MSWRRRLFRCPEEDLAVIVVTASIAVTETMVVVVVSGMRVVVVVIAMLMIVMALVVAVAVTMAIRGRVLRGVACPARQCDELEADIPRLARTKRENDPVDSPDQSTRGRTLRGPEVCSQIRENSGRFGRLVRADERIRMHQGILNSRVREYRGIGTGERGDGEDDQEARKDSHEHIPFAKTADGVPASWVDPSAGSRRHAPREAQEHSIRNCL